MKAVVWIAGIWFATFGFWPGVPWDLDHGEMQIPTVLDWSFHWFGIGLLVVLLWDSFRRAAKRLREIADRRRE